MKSITSILGLSAALAGGLSVPAEAQMPDRTVSADMARPLSAGALEQPTNQHDPQVRNFPPMAVSGADISSASNGPAAADDRVILAAAEAESDKGRRRLGSSLEEIIVTAQRRTERLQDVPVSISVITADDIERRGLVEAADYLRGVPGVNQVEGGYGGQAIVIRGLATDTGAQNYTRGSTTATYFGETPTTGSAGTLGSNLDIKLVDIERVEILRGPQGTALGSSSMGGAVRIIPAEPKPDEFEGAVILGYSATSGSGGDNYNAQLVGNIPLINDKLTIRATAYRYEDSGYYRNRAGSTAAFVESVAPFGAQAFAADEEEVGANDILGGRVTALFQLNENLKFKLSYLSQKDESDNFPMANSGTYEQTLLAVAPEHVRRRGQSGGLSDTDIEITNAVMEYDVGWANVLATYSYLEGGKTDAVPLFSFLGNPWPLSFDALNDYRQHVGEVRIATKLEGAWNFLAGLYTERQDSEDERTYYWYGDPASNFFLPGERFMGATFNQHDLTQKAAFGEAAWEFLSGLTFTGGVRYYEYDLSSRANSTGPGPLVTDSSSKTSNDYSGSNFRSSLSYKLNDDMLLYAGWAQGFRPGASDLSQQSSGGICDLDTDGIVDGTALPLTSLFKVKSDSVDSYELGGKFTLLGRRLLIDTAVFRMDWKDIPVLALLQCNGTSVGVTTNAGGARSDGIEFQSKLQLTDALRVDLGGSWVDAQLTEDVPAQGWLTGDQLPGSAKVNANFGLQYMFDVTGHLVSLRTDAIYVGPVYSQITQSANTRAGDYVKLDASARVAFRNLIIDIYARNLTNEDAFTSRDFVSTGMFNGYRLRPRTIGVQLGYNF